MIQYSVQFWMEPYWYTVIPGKVYSYETAIRVLNISMQEGHPGYKHRVLEHYGDKVKEIHSTSVETIKFLENQNDS